MSSWSHLLLNVLSQDFLCGIVVAILMNFYWASVGCQTTYIISFTLRILLVLFADSVLNVIQYWFSKRKFKCTPSKVTWLISGRVRIWIHISESMARLKFSPDHATPCVFGVSLCNRSFPQSSMGLFSPYHHSSLCLSAPPPLQW